jgi:type VI secretion system protein ImpK
MTVVLIDKFHEFYEELLAVDKQLDTGAISAGIAHERLASLLNRQEAEAQRGSGTYGRDLFQRAKYAMAALADEILLNSDHPHDAHARVWGSHLMETALFRSQRAGEKIFDDIAEMQNLGAGAGELARVYLAVLGLGFQGVWRLMQGSEEKIAFDRKKLFRLAYGRDPVAITGQKRIAPAAYASTLTDGESGKLPHLRPWIYAMALLVLFYVAGSFAIWRYATYDLEPKVQAINKIEVQTGGLPTP